MSDAQVCTTSYASASLFADTLLCSKPLVCTANIVSRATVSPRNTHRPRGPSPPYRTIQLVHACGRHKTPAQDYVTKTHRTRNRHVYPLAKSKQPLFPPSRGGGVRWTRRGTTVVEEEPERFLLVCGCSWAWVEPGRGCDQS